MPAETGNTLLVHYTGTLSDGSEFDSSREREPLEFVLGQGMLIPGFENALIGREIGDTVSVDIPAEKAYGERTDDLVIVLPRAEIPPHITPEEGALLQLSLEDGELEVVITRVTDDEVELDGNHPLAGETLHFEIEVMDINTRASC